MYKVAACGMLIGIANLIPGVSGATMAVITNQYKKIIDECDKIMMGQFATVSFGYLLGIGLGALIGIVALSNPLHYIMIHHEALALYAIAGGVLGSLKAVKMLPTPQPLVRQCMHPLFFLGLCGLMVLIGLDAMQIMVIKKISMTHFFLSGSLAVIAMLVPGISGAMLLVVFGTYTPLLAAIKTLDLVALASFFCGAVLGGIASIKGIQWGLKKKPNQSQSLVMGLYVGSIAFILLQIDWAVTNNISGGMLFVAMTAASYRLIEYGKR